VDVDVLTGTNRLYGDADGDAVLEDLVTFGQFHQRELVAQRNTVPQDARDAVPPAALHDGSMHLTGLQVPHRHRDRIAFVVNEELRGRSHRIGLRHRSSYW